jgi:hypothetical protein
MPTEITEIMLRKETALVFSQILGGQPNDYYLPKPLIIRLKEEMRDYQSKPSVHLIPGNPPLYYVRFKGKSVECSCSGNELNWTLDMFSDRIIKPAVHALLSKGR